jgi:hypothetical protein
MLAEMIGTVSSIAYCHETWPGANDQAITNDVASGFRHGA